MREQQHYLALDLEYNCDGKNPTEDIIQVGLAIGSPDKGVFLQESYPVSPEKIYYPNFTNCKNENEP